MAVETTILSGSYLDNWEDFKRIFTSELDSDGDGRIGDDGSGPKLRGTNRQLDRLDRFFNDSLQDSLTILGPGVPTREEFIKAVDPDGDGAVGTGGGQGRTPSVDRALRIYDRALRSFERNSDSSSSLFASPESLALGVDFSIQAPSDPVVFGGDQPIARFTDLVGPEPEVITSDLPEMLDIGGLASDLDTLESDDGFAGFKKGAKGGKS